MSKVNKTKPSEPVKELLKGARVKATDRAAMKKLFITLIIAAIIAMIGFVINGIVSATTQESKSNHKISQINSTNSDKQNTIVTWLETNKTKTSSK
jgi:hypothetical protein